MIPPQGAKRGGRRHPLDCNHAGRRPGVVSVGGGSSVALAAEVHAEALAAAAAYAVVLTTYEAVNAELSATVRRLRAIERRWVPEHEAALHKLDTIRVRWALEQQ